MIGASLYDTIYHYQVAQTYYLTLQSQSFTLVVKEKQVLPNIKATCSKWN